MVNNNNKRWTFNVKALVGLKRLQLQVYWHFGNPSLLWIFFFPFEAKRVPKYDFVFPSICLRCSGQPYMVMGWVMDCGMMLKWRTEHFTRVSINFQLFIVVHGKCSPSYTFPFIIIREKTNGIVWTITNRLCAACCVLCYCMTQFHFFYDSSSIILFLSWFVLWTQFAICISWVLISDSWICMALWVPSGRPFWK